MELAKIFLNNSFNNAKVISRDSKIYEAFKPYLFDMQGISLEEFMKDKNLRRTYRQKFITIKSRLQEMKKSPTCMKDEQYLTYISKASREWQEFLTTAKDNTLDNGESFIRSIPLERYILMTPSQKNDLEKKLVNSAIERVRTFMQDRKPQSDSSELNAMIYSNNDSVAKEDIRKI